MLSVQMSHSVGAQIGWGGGVATKGRTRENWNV